MQAQYESYRGIEFAAIEIKRNANFLTHVVDPNTDVLDTYIHNPLLTPILSGAAFDSEEYVFHDSYGNGFRVKTYLKNNEIYILFILGVLHDRAVKIYEKTYQTNSTK